MTEHDILKSIAANLCERKTVVALSNYEVLCSNIKYVNDVLRYCTFTLGGITQAGQSTLLDAANINAAFQERETQGPFTRIVPRVLANGASIIHKFLRETEPDDRSGVTIDTVGRLRRGFEQYSDLATTARQTLDSLVSDSYQLLKLDPREINYHVLVSLNSFDKYVTPSIRQALFNQEVTDAIAEFRKMPFNQWHNSAITQCQHRTFAQKVDFIFAQLATAPDAGLADEMKNLFKFSSEFTHIGYVSTFFSSSVASEVVFGDDHGPYLPSTENFSELKYEILVTITKVITEVYIPCISQSLSAMMVSVNAAGFSRSLDALSTETNARLKTRNAQYYFFIKKGLVGSQEAVELPCRCGVTKRWMPPHDQMDLYCKGCGSKFNLMEVEGDAGYVITSSGPTKIIGCSVPDFNDLPPADQYRMLKQVEESMRKKNGC